MQIKKQNENCLIANTTLNMKKCIIAAVLFLFSTAIFGQKINGQWRGYFDSNGDIVLSGGENTEYVLEIEVKGPKVSGYSYSYFQNRSYYVICSLAGTYDKTTKSIRVTETARIKGVTPPDWTDCLQTHILTYQKEGDTEQLAGRWITAPGQTGNCGLGKTTLTRRTLSKNLSSYNKSSKVSPFSKPKPVKKLPDLSDKNKKTLKQPLAKNNVTTGVKKPATPGVKTVAKPKLTATGTLPVKVKTKPNIATADTAIKSKTLQRSVVDILAPQATKKEVTVTAPNQNFEKRSNDIIKTIEIDHPTFKVDLYDNGDIDGDSVSLFYNGKLLLSRKRLTDKPITLTLDASTGNDINELTMYAENLGTIPPNTALMVITDGDKRYEVRISSDLKKSGTIRFVKKERLPVP